MNRYCLVCTPRSGSFYILNHLSYNMNLANGKEWFGRMKKVHYDGFKTSSIDVNYKMDEKLLTNKERSKRLIYLKNNQNYIIKCMPLQLSYTIEDNDLSYEEKLNIAYKILSNFQLFWLHNKNKISQFCFRVVAEETSKNGTKEFSDYNKKKRQTPEPNSFTATKENFEKFMLIEKFTEDLEQMFPRKKDIIYENYIKQNNIEIIKNPNYQKIFTNYEEIEEWFRF